MGSKLIENRHIRVFISSTFRDMQDERDFLMKYTFPRLKKLAGERDVLLTELDLRWGITEEESRAGKVVEICLKEIEQSIPFFIGIIGNRYGWIPRKEDLRDGYSVRFPQLDQYLANGWSVTEMEMQYGVLQRDTDMHAYFYIKRDENHQDCDYPEALSKLKTQVLENDRYPVSYYSSVEELAADIEESFIRLLDRLFPRVNITPHEKEVFSQQSYRNSQCVGYVRFEEPFSVVTEWIHSGNSHLVITGKSGLGKSAFIANLAADLEKNEQFNVVYYFVGNGSGETSHTVICRYLFKRICDLYDIEGAKTLDDCFSWIESNQAKPLVLLIDAVNQLSDRDNAKLMNWIPSPTSRVHIIYSTLEGDETIDIFQGRGYKTLTLLPMDSDRREELIVSHLALYGKKLTRHQVHRLAEERICENTLVMRTLLDELIRFGVYEQLDERIDGFLSAPSVESFFSKLLECYEQDYTREFVSKVLSFIAVSRKGLQEDEIMSLCGLKQLEWSSFYCSFSPHLISRSGLLDFSHSHIRDAVTKRYLPESVMENDFRKTLIEFFIGTEDIRAKEEIPHQYFLLNDSVSLHSWLVSDISRSTYIVNQDASELAKYWKMLKAAGYSISDYLSCLEGMSPAERPYIDLISLCIEYFSDYEVAAAFCSAFRSDVDDGITIDEESKLELLIWEGILSRSHCNYEAALEKFTLAYELADKVYGDGHINCSYPLKHIGTIHNERREYSLADSCYRKAYYIQKKNKYAKQAIDTLHSIADNCLDSGDYVKAEEYLNDAMADARSLFGPKNSTISSLLNSLAALYDHIGEHEKSITTSLKSIAMDKEILGEFHIDIAHSYHNLSMTYRHIKEWNNAEQCSLQAIRIKERILGTDNYEVAITRAGLGEIYREQGKYDKALPLHQQYLECYINTIGENAYVACILAGIGSDYEGTENYPSALEYYLKALAVDEKYSGRAHHQYYNAVGNALYYLDRYEDAIHYFQEGLAIAEQEREEYAMSIFYFCIGDSYGFLGRFEDALSSFEKALEIRERILPPGDKRIERCREYIRRAENAINPDE